MSIQVRLLQSIMDFRKKNFNLTQEQFAELYEDRFSVSVELVLDAVKKAEKDDAPPVDDDLLYSLGEYYSSQYVEKNKPWVREIPFAEWMQRQLNSGGHIDVGQL
ncbi:hypothetical protein SD70_29630 [Gordoniibacillus kamchatkensis]|uniref:Uncharacterized protein n=1 Tax=Gordoniibacillus kamchatkensis TaxID=1590651 RepID=A0ABR5AAE7_9BACL|nr:hypothetical protein [Paenibacillus sp. VKM B-2647]KIL37952.1 hypothetical protein SD70_29630 [Paenibacillus sp. VKM B-2647]